MSGVGPTPTLYRSRPYGWRCRLVHRMPHGAVRVRWLDGPLAGREASPLKETLREES